MEYHDLNSTLIESEGRKPIKDYFTKKVLLVTLTVFKLVLKFQFLKQNNSWIDGSVRRFTGFINRELHAIKSPHKLDCSERKIRRTARAINA